MEPTTYTDQSLRDLLRRIARRRRLLLAVGITVFLVVAAWTFLATPRFESRAVLRIESKSSMPVLPDAVKDLPGLSALTKDELETDIGFRNPSYREGTGYQSPRYAQLTVSLDF